MTIPITAKRLRLRRFTLDDRTDILNFLSHPSVARATPEIEATEEGVNQYIKIQNNYRPFEPEKCFDLAIERKGDGRVLGLLTLVCKAHKQGELGFALGINHRGKGYATEAAATVIEYAFTVLGLHRIQASTTKVNPGSYRVMERLGMQREACLREATIEDGVWVDTLVYGLLAEEWEMENGRRKT